jgi:hypothetical protein
MMAVEIGLGGFMEEGMQRPMFTELFPILAVRDFIGSPAPG